MSYEKTSEQGLHAIVSGKDSAVDELLARFTAMEKRVLEMEKEALQEKTKKEESEAKLRYTMAHGRALEKALRRNVRFNFFSNLNTNYIARIPRISTALDTEKS